MNTKLPECFSTDQNADCLRIEISATHSLLLPFDQFAFSELTSVDKEQKLRLIFASHEILISGQALRRIETAMQRMELAYVAVLPLKYHLLMAEAQPLIREIVVTEMKPVATESQQN